MIYSLLQIINPEEVIERHYFLEPLKAEPILWCIRGGCILAAVVFLVIYWKMKRRNGE